MSSRLLWQPSESRARGSNLFAFLSKCSSRHGFKPDWETLRRWSIDRSDLFWTELLEFAAVHPSAPAESTRSGEGMLGTRWFPGLTLNYARHLTRFEGEAPAIHLENELGRRVTISRDELRRLVARCSAALRAAGVRKGDRVAAFMPNLPETVIAMLATASLGAIWSSCSPDFGIRGVLDRFGQVEPTVLIAADGYSYNGKPFPVQDRVRQFLDALPSVRRAVIVPHLAEHPSLSGLRDAVHWADFLGHGPHPELRFEEVPFDHPLFIMYSSGTTGVPKCIVHGHGGTLLQHMKELMLHTDVKEGQNVFYFTTCGWMMWNWLVSALGIGAAVVLYEGNPAFPNAHRLWELAERLPIHVFGTSPKFLGACQKADVLPGRQHKLDSLRAVLSTGSPLSAELFEWVYREIASDLQLSSICGGTDIVSCFMLGNPLLPVHAGEIQCRGLAMDVHAFDAYGRPVVGQQGELVCCGPFPSQPIGFWNDPDGRKYRAAYFEFAWRETPAESNAAGAAPTAREPVWRHGDFVTITEHGGVIVYGRSDATLNPGGVRIGTAEIYRIVEAMPEIVDSIVVGRRTADEDEDVCLFVTLRPGQALTAELERRIRDQIAAEASRRHVPKFIRQVPEIPHTISGKKVELAVQNVLHGQEVKNRDALANPGSLDAFRGLI